MKLDASWYSEIGGVGRQERYKMGDKAVCEVGNRLEELVRDLQADTHVRAPISSDGQWQDFISKLPTHGNGEHSAPGVVTNAGPIAASRL
jgi:acyl-CoA oxidase